MILQLGMGLLPTAIICLVISLILGAREAVLAFRAWWDGRVDSKREIEMLEIAHALNSVVDELITLDNKVNHYRHNIHCPTCGMFAAQAEGWPEGTANCLVHGIALRTTEWTGSIPILVIELDADPVPPILAPEAPSLVIEPPALLPDHLTELEEIHP